MKHNPYNLTYIGEKQKIREMLCNYLPKVRKIVTLPSHTGHDVRLFKEKWPTATIIGIERDKETFLKCCELVDADMYNGTVTEWLETQTLPSSHVDVFYMDYCSWVDPVKLNDIKLFLSNDNIFHKGRTSLLGLTFSKSNRVGNDEMINDIKDSIYVKEGDIVTNSLESISDYIYNKIDSHNIVHRFEEVYSKEYKAKEGSQPMYFLMYKITK